MTKAKADARPRELEKAKEKVNEVPKEGTGDPQQSKQNRRKHIPYSRGWRPPLPTLDRPAVYLPVNKTKEIRDPRNTMEQLWGLQRDPH